MKAIKSVVVLIIVSIILSNCSENADEEPTPNPNGPEDGELTDEQLSYLDNAKDTTVRLEDVMLDDNLSVKDFLEENDPNFLNKYPSGRVGQTEALSPKNQKLKFLARMIAMGNYLADDNNHTYPSDGPDKPAQIGLAYSWGSKDYNVRKTPPGPGGECTDKQIYGLDCSGMLWVMTQAANIEVEPKYNFFVEYITDAKKWTKAFQASVDYKDLEMKDMGQLAKGKIKNGDIVLWKDHVGVYLYGSFYQSNGTKRKRNICDNNLKPFRGPRLASLSETLDNVLGSYKVFRVVYGQDYTLKIIQDYSGVSLTSPFCKLGAYIDSTVINITVTAKDEVILNSIKNFDPAVSYSSNVCTCLGMTFGNGSLVEYTDFIGTYNTSIDPKNPNAILVYDLKYTFCSPTDKYSCEGVTSSIAGLTVPGNEIGGNIDLPTEEEGEFGYPWDSNGQLIVTYVKQ